MIIHAEDDEVINIHLARKLFKAATDGGKHNIDIITVDKSHGLGHSSIYRFQDLPDIVSKYCRSDK